MKKFLPLFLLLFSFKQICFAQDYSSRWLFTSEISPSFPTMKDRVVENADRYSSLEWRNRFGVRTFGNLFIGVQGSVRNYSETLSLESLDSQISSTIESKLQNTMLGFGPFFNYYLEMSPKFYLLASGFIGLEKGVGNFKYDLVNFNCPTCEIGGVIGEYPQRLGQTSFKDVLLTYSSDFGFGYLINDAIGVQLMVNLLRYERSSFMSREYIGENFNNPGFRMSYSESVRGFSAINDRMIFHLGIFMALNLE
ncbi:hypothetical protein CLW00_101183 [Mongoliibacter ruber]|uniref:Outer membrane protein with beta-barrel domain n=2 Tax=Mongoliibacter ruber TaxID=1750599 RepID=A0A2T0WUZ2_9BACT|nr:hypothetical protein CLW00_101183 [Mongoliibacter ruber]